MSPQQPISARALKRIRSLAVLGVVLAAAASLMLTNAFGVGNGGVSSGAGAHPLLGISGNPGHFKAQTGQASLVDEAFLGWGQGVSYGLPFAALFPAFGPIPMIHLGTKSQTGHEAITPQGIASGAGDAYLIALNHAIAAWGKAIYVRPMAEMNNAANFYSAYETDGQARDASHSTASYQAAFERIYVILHGGLTSSVNARLRGLGLAPVPDGTELPANPFPMLRIIWSPLASSNPPVPGNAADQYYPGNRFVDVEGGDIYDEQLTDTAPWAGLETLFDHARADRKPFSIPEWGLFGVDDPAFVKHMCTFLGTHRSTEVAVFYEGVGSTFDLASKPKSRAAYRQCLTPLGGGFPSWALANEPGGGARVVSLGLKATPDAGAAPLAVTFSVSAKLSVPILHWEVAYGDGAEVDGSGTPPTTLQHSYSQEGTYQAVLFVFRAAPFAPEDTPFFTTADVTAGSGPAPFVSFAPTPTAGPTPLSVSFQTDVHSPTPVTDWTMVFGDGFTRTGTGTPPHFTGHTFATRGSYEVLLILDSAGGKQIASVSQVTAGGGSGGTTTTTTTTTTATTIPEPPATGTETGTVLVGGKPFTGGHIPYHTTVDVSHGKLLLTSNGGHVSVYGSGVPSKFQLFVTTDNGKPIVQLGLVGGDFTGCTTHKSTRSVAISAAAPAQGKTIRQLWGSGKGHFKTKGRYAAATVRGTIWLTRDTCNGTLIVVKRGVVQVYDVKLKKFITVTAGHSYFAKA